MSPNSSPDLLSVVSEMTGRTPEQIRSASASERKILLDGIMSDPGWPDRFRDFNISRREQLADHIESASQKSWFKEYVYNENHPILGTAWNLVTMKPVEGVVNSIPLVSRIPYIGKVARWAAVAATAYFGMEIFKRGAQIAYEGGNILLDRMGVGAGRLVPPMELPPAPYQLQPLPPADIGATA